MLTPRQAAFVEAIDAGCHPRQARQRAGYRSAATRSLLRSPRVRDALRDRFEAAHAARRHDAELMPLCRDGPAPAETFAVLGDLLQERGHPAAALLRMALACPRWTPLAVERHGMRCRDDRELVRSVVVLRFEPFAEAIGLAPGERSLETEFVLLPSIDHAGRYLVGDEATSHQDPCWPPTVITPTPQLVARTPVSWRVYEALSDRDDLPDDREPGAPATLPWDEATAWSLSLGLRLPTLEMWGEAAGLADAEPRTLPMQERVFWWQREREGLPTPRADAGPANHHGLYSLLGGGSEATRRRESDGELHCCALSERGGWFWERYCGFDRWPARLSNWADSSELRPVADGAPDWRAHRAHLEPADPCDGLDERLSMDARVALRTPALWLMRARQRRSLDADELAWLASVASEGGAAGELARRLLDLAEAAKEGLASPSRLRAEDGARQGPWWLNELLSFPDPDVQAAAESLIAGDSALAEAQLANPNGDVREALVVGLGDALCPAKLVALASEDPERQVVRAALGSLRSGRRGPAPDLSAVVERVLAEDWPLDTLDYRPRSLLVRHVEPTRLLAHLRRHLASGDPERVRCALEASEQGDPNERHDPPPAERVDTSCLLTLIVPHLDSGDWSLRKAAAWALALSDEALAALLRAYGKAWEAEDDARELATRLWRAPDWTLRAAGGLSRRTRAALFNTICSSVGSLPVGVVVRVIEHLEATRPRTRWPGRLRSPLTRAQLAETLLYAYTAWTYDDQRIPIPLSAYEPHDPLLARSVARLALRHCRRSEACERAEVIIRVAERHLAERPPGTPAPARAIR